MAIRHWLRKALADKDSDGDAPPQARLLRSIFGRDAPQLHALGEYDADSYPEALETLLRRRQEVADQVVAMGLTDRKRRVEAIPQLKELLQKYPHPLAYETLILAYIDTGNYDAARGVAFAARERRIECERSPHPEIRAETDRLREWTPEDVDAVREEREGAGTG